MLKLRKLAILLLVSCSLNLYGFVGYYLVMNDAGHKVLLLGDWHRKTDILQVNAQHVQTLVRECMKSKASRPIPCYTELSEHEENYAKKLEKAVPDTFTELFRQKNACSANLDIIHCDPRDLQGSGLFFSRHLDEFQQVFGESMQEAQNSSDEMPIHPDSWKNYASDQAHSGIPYYSMKDYLNGFERYRLLLTEIKDRYRDHEKLQVIFTEWCQRFHENYETLAQTFDSAKEKDVGLALIEQFSQCTDVHQVVTIFTRLISLLDATDHIIADAVFLDKVIQASLKGESCIMITGLQHANTIVKVLIKMGYRLLEGDTALTKHDSLQMLFKRKKFNTFDNCIAQVVKHFLAVEPCCNVCLKQGELKKCMRCHQIRYCSSACQRADWPQHQLLYPTCAPTTNTISRNSIFYC